jgi:hypothetical protein
MKRFFTLILLLQITNLVLAQQSITALNTSFTQNFNGMGSTATAALPTGWRMGTNSTSTNWSVLTTATSLSAGTTGTGVLSSFSTGGAYNFANGINASSTDRAIGFLTSGSYGSPRSIIYAFTNNTGSTVNTISLQWDFEKYRSGTRQFDWTFFHGNTTTVTTAATAGNQTYVANTNNTTIFNPPSTNTRTLTLTGLNIPNGTTYYLRWTLSGLSCTTTACSNGQGLGIDNFSISLDCAVTPGYCSNTTSYGTATAGTNNAPVTIDLCNLRSDYSVVSGIVSGSTYQFGYSLGGWITLRNASTNAVLTAGTAPLSWTATINGSVQVHYNTSSCCGTATNCGTSTVTCTSCPAPPPGCNNLTGYPLPFNAPTTGTTYTIVTDQWQEEYNTVNNVIAGTTFESAYSLGAYITVRYGSVNGPVVAAGNSILDWTATSSGTYYIHYNVDNLCNTAQLSGTSTLTCTSCSGYIANDLVCNAISVSCNTTVNGTTIGATNNNTGENQTCGEPQTQPGVWYVIAGTGDIMTASLCGTSTWDSKISLFSGTSCATLTCVGGVDDDGPSCSGEPASYSWTSAIGTNYYILVHGFSSTSTFSLALTCPPSNPTSISVSSNYVCAGSGSSVTLTANGAVGTVYWFSGSCGTTGQIGTGNSIVVTPSATTTYYARNFNSGQFSNNCANTEIEVRTAPAVVAGANVSICSGQSTQFSATASDSEPNSLTVSTLNNNGCTGGNQFDITPSVAVTLTSFDITPDITGTQTVNVYYKTGTYVGSETTSASWTLLGSYTVTGTADVLINMPVTNLPLAAGTTYGIYLNYNAAYSTGSASVSDGLISVSAGAGLCGQFSLVNSPRTFLGRVNYNYNPNVSLSWSPSATLSASNILNPVATPLANTTYTLTGSSLGCSSSSNLTVTVNAIPSITITGANSICSGTSTTFTASGGTSYLWSTGATTAAITVSTAQTYSVTVTNADGCTATSNRTLTVNANPTATVTGANTICSGNSTTFTASGGTSYLWSTGATTAAITVSTPQTYTVTVTISSGCTASSNRTLSNFIPAPTITGANSICNGFSSTLTASGGTDYNWYSNSSGTNLIWSGATFTTPVLTANTTYYVSNVIYNNTTSYNYTAPVQSSNLTGGNLIYNVASVPMNPTGDAVLTVYAMGDIEFNPSELVTVIGETGVLGSFNGPTQCGTTYTSVTYTIPLSTLNTWVANGSIDLTMDGGTAVTAGLCTSGGAHSIRGYFTITYPYSTIGCTSTLTPVTITVNANPTVAIAGTNTICPGTSTTFTASGGTNYLWSTGATTAAITVSTAQTYNVTVTNAAGCTATSNSTLSISNPTATISGVNTICSGAPRTLTASGGTSYLWSTGATTTTISVTAAQTYSVTTTNANGCTATSNITMTANTNPVAAISGTNAICTGTSTTFTASGGTSYLWSTGEVTAAITASTVQTYTVTVTNAAGCTATSNITLTNVIPAPTVTGTNSICNGFSTTLTASGGSNYNWYSNPSGTTLVGTGATFTTPVLTANTTYYVSNVANSNSSTYNYTAPVQLSNLIGGDLIFNVPSVPVNPTGDAVLTVYAMGDIDQAAELVTVIGETGTLGSFNGPQCGTTFTSVTYTIPLATLNTWVSNGSINLTMDGATGVTASLCSTGGTHSIRGYFTITFPYTVSCSSVLTPVNITVNANPTVSPSFAANPICSGASTTLNANGTSGSGSISTYAWSSGISGNNASGNVGSTGTYTVTVTNSNGCTATANSAALSLNSLPSVSASASSTTVCEGSNVTLTGSGATSYSWSGGITDGQAFAATTSTTTYNVTGTDANGCRGTSSVNLVVNTISTAPTVSAVAGRLCPNTNSTVSAGGGTAGTGAVINWYSGPNGTGTLLGTGASISLPFAASTTVYVRREGACNNTADVSTTIDIRAFMTISANSATTSNYCVDDFGWGHWYDSNDEIIFSAKGDFSMCPPGYPQAVVSKNSTNSFYNMSQNSTSLCANNQTPGEMRFEMGRSWNLDMGGATPSGLYSVRFYFLSSERSSVINAAADTMANAAYTSCGYSMKYNSSNNGWFWFKNVGTTYVAPQWEGVLYDGATNTTSNGVTYVEMDSIPSFSGGSGGVILVPNSTLPISWKSFNGETNNKVNFLKWITATEQNTEYFEVERSADGINFETIGLVAASGNISSDKLYNFDDNNPILGINYYRLRLVEIDGTTEYSNVIALEVKGDKKPYIFYPNPVTEVLNYQFTAEQGGDVIIEVMDALGRVLKSENKNSVAGSNQFLIDMSNLIQGTYSIRVRHLQSAEMHTDIIIKK